MKTCNLKITMVEFLPTLRSSSDAIFGDRPFHIK